MAKYKITGTNKEGRQFSPIHTDTPQHYNIWKGTLWLLHDNGKYKKVRSYEN